MLRNGEHEPRLCTRLNQDSVRARLRHLLAEHEARLGSLADLGRAIDSASCALLQDHEDLVADHASLMADHDLLCKDRADLRRECGALRDCPRCQQCGGSKAGPFLDALHLPGLASALGKVAGFLAARKVAELSRSHSMAMAECLPHLARAMPPDVYVFGGKNDDAPALITAERLCIATGEWQALPGMLKPRYGCAAASLRGHLYVFGGNDGRQTLDSVERFDVAANAWERLPPMLEERSRCGAASLLGMLYVCGGQRTTTCERFDVDRSSWEEMPPMHMMDLLGCSAAELRGRLCVVGAAANQQMTVALFDPWEMQWDEMPPPCSRRFGCATAVAAGMIYVFGGHDGREAVGLVEVFDPTNGRWRLDSSLVPTPRHGSAAVSVADVVYLAGGDDGKPPSDSDGGASLAWVERYFPATGSWEVLPPLPTGRFGCAVAASWR